MRRPAGLLILLSSWLFPVVGRADDNAFFEKEVRPILVGRCYRCHSGLKTNGGLSLDARVGWQKGGDGGPAVVPGDPDGSPLIQAVRYESLEMPPADDGGKLSDAEIATLTEWVKRGAPDPRVQAPPLARMSAEAARSWWAFQPLPAEREPGTSGQLDAFIDRELTARSIEPSPPADRRTLIRRATYDLTGLPPTPEAVERFLADDSDDAFAKLIDGLLESPQYGVRWGRHWLDVVRYADTAGENTDRPLPHAWRYRNWVIDAFNRDLPYDEFVRRQLAGDLLPADGPAARAEGIVATGYLAIARRFGHDIDKDVHLMHEDVIDNLGKNFLGLSVACARCHDHKYDPITAADYYALYGIFESTRFAFPGCEPKGQPRDLVPLLEAVEIERRNLAWKERNAGAEAANREREARIAAAGGRYQEMMTTSARLLATSPVGEGRTVAFADGRRGELDRLAVRRGDVLQLTVVPNASHGADTTRVEWEIAAADGSGRWDLADVIPNLHQGNPHAAAGGASWCFLDVTAGARFLENKQAAINGRGELSGWNLDELPSVFVNAAGDPVPVWTSLPARSFFVHPGPNRPVAVAWVSPIDGEVRVSGRVTDAHPDGGDGVGFRLDHLSNPDAGPALLELGRLVTSPRAAVEPAPVVPVAYAVVEGNARDVPVQLRGEPEKPGEVIPRRWLSVLGGDAVPPDAGSGRRELGEWVATSPLAARVMVNRIWLGHFGRGLVASPNDFGSRGEAPSHPELLDWLAARFRDGGYRVKAMHRLIMLSDAYRRGSDPSESARLGDADGRHRSHFARRRLTAEEIRDSLLTAAGTLDPSLGEAHPFPPESAWNYTQHEPFAAVYETRRRSAFLMVQRQRRDPYLALFDGADPNASTALRPTTTVPTQALYFLNAPFFHEQAAAAARRITETSGDDERIDRAWQVLYQRPPRPAEREAAAAFLREYPAETDDRWTALARVLLASNEFLFVD